MTSGHELSTRSTKPSRFGVHFSAWRVVFATVVIIAWVSASRGRVHPLLVALPAIAVMTIVFATIYHVSLTRWIRLWWSWLASRNAPMPAPGGSSARDVLIDPDLSIGVLIENHTLVTALELMPDPRAPTVVADDEERTVNTVTVARLAAMLRIDDIKLSSIDLISMGYRAAGPFANRYQQIIGHTPATAHRNTWIIMRISIEDNLGALARRGLTVQAAERTAAETCQRVADALSGDGVGARPASTAQIVSANAKLHSAPPIADNWSHLATANSHACIYYSDPTHIKEDVPRWWSWPQATDVSTLIRLVDSPSGPRLGALVRYRAVARPKVSPASRLGPLHGVQKSMWAQFGIGSVPSAAPIPSALLAGSDMAVPFGPTGQLLGFIGSAAVHMPLVGAVTVLCGARLLLREVALRATVTGRPMIIVTDTPDLWSQIAACAVAAQIVDRVPETIDDNAILVIDGDCPAVLPAVTVITTDQNCTADIELVDVDVEPQQHTFTLKSRLGLSARLCAVETHEERLLLT
jgi:type VII secretion protein EccE